MSPIVAIDIETTGLDSEKDAIIEIAAVKFTGRRVEEEWSSLINPGRPIPPQITALTNINSDMVRNAPALKSVVHELADFVGDFPVLGHSVRFDLSFLRKAQILGFNDVIDTYELASVLMPSASRYSLGSLGQQLGILIPNSHRALDDARLTHAVFMAMYERGLALPVDILEEIVRQGEPLDWDGNWFFQQVLRARVKQPLGPKPGGQADYAGMFGGVVDFGQPLTPKTVLEPLNLDEVAAALEPGGSFDAFFNQYEYRTQQVEMLRSVANAFSQSSHLMVEAGTGTGKSFAYLIPAALWALKNNSRVVISTHTITLQDQLISKDLPNLREALGVDLRSAILKGRSNYLCPRRLDALRQRGPGSSEEMRLLGKVLVWLNENGNGDRSEINLGSPMERDAWLRISAEDEGCKAETCLERTGGVCPFYKARMAAQSAHILVVNHALLLADVVTGSRVLPEYQYLVVDEAHHLEGATTSALSYRLSEMDTERMLKELGSLSSGILGRLMNELRGVLGPAELAAYQQAVQRLTDLAFRLDHDFGRLFEAFEDFMADARDNQPLGAYGQQLRVVPSSRTLPIWEVVEIGWDTAGETMELLIKLLTELHATLADNIEHAPESLTDTVGDLGSLLRRFDEAKRGLTGLISKPDENYIYWLEKLPSGYKLVMQVAPLQVGSLMEEYLWHTKSSIVLTSATLTTNGEFDYLRGRLNADEADELVLGSPFDYENAALLYLVNDIPEPQDAFGYQRAVDQVLVSLSKATGGRLMALFTSYAQLRKTSAAISQPLSEAGITVYEQGSGASTNTLLETFRGEEKAVLLGTRAFWEGVDIPGEALSVLVIVRLPFDVPSDPIIAARSETFDDPFSEYSIPEAILRFRQGFGRLIRTQSDRGVVVILDKRVITKKYGRMFLDSLPGCTIKQAPMADLPKSAARWLNL
jgi:DNA polymerase-3 subunit epsilon/ATP-dependent DNA helicase DinG